MRSETSRSPSASRPSSCPSLPCFQAPSSTGQSSTTLASFGRWTLTLLLDLSSRRNAGKQPTVYSTTLTCKFLIRQSRPKSCLRLRTYLMYTTAAIMSIGVLFDILVVYYAKFVQPYPLLFNLDSETWTSSLKQWWRQSRTRWPHLTPSHCKFWNRNYYADFQQIHKNGFFDCANEYLITMKLSP